MSFSPSYRKINIDYACGAGVQSFGLYSPTRFSFPFLNSLSSRYSFGLNSSYMSLFPSLFGFGSGNAYQVSSYFPNYSSFAPSGSSYKSSYGPISLPSFSSTQASYSLNSSYGPTSLGKVSSFGALTSTRRTPDGYSTVKFEYKPVAAEVKGKLGPEFLAKVKQVAQNINCDYKDLLAVMNSESGLDSTVQNKAGYDAWGLIQFTSETAAELGTTIPKLIAMSPVEQLDYVEKFYKKARKDRGFGNKKFSAGDLYAITFLPARAKRDVLCVKGERFTSGKRKGQLKNYYEANSGFDRNGNNKIEKWELSARMAEFRVDEQIFAVA